MEASQGEVSAIERRTDHYVSTLRRYVTAMGGELEIIARFPNGEAIKIQRFGDIQPDEPTEDQQTPPLVAAARKR
jgi:hypothetical protein